MTAVSGHVQVIMTHVQDSCHLNYHASAATDCSMVRSSRNQSRMSTVTREKGMQVMSMKSRSLIKRVACYARAETFTEAVASVASMVATPSARARASLG